MSTISSTPQPKQQKGESWADMVTVTPKPAPSVQPKQPAARDAVTTRAAAAAEPKREDKKKPPIFDDLKRFRDDCELLMASLEELDGKIEACIVEKNRLMSVSAQDNVKTYIENSANSAIALLLDTVRKTATRLQPTESIPTRRPRHDHKESHHLVVANGDEDDKHLDTATVIIPPPRRDDAKMIDAVSASTLTTTATQNISKTSYIYENNDFRPRWKFMFSHPTEHEADSLATVTTNSEYLAELRNCSSLYHVLRGFGTNTVSFVATEKKPNTSGKASMCVHVLPSWFVFMYFKYMFTLHGTNDHYHDFGTELCRECKKYHRMHRLEAFCRKLENLGYASHYRLKKDEEKEDFYRSVVKLVELDTKQSFVKVRHYVTSMCKSEIVPAKCDTLWLDFMNRIFEPVSCELASSANSKA